MSSTPAAAAADGLLLAHAVPTAEQEVQGDAVHPHSDHPELHFYDPAAVLGVPRDVAFGYLVLLTGGAVDYEPPAPNGGGEQQESQKTSNKHPQHKLGLDEEAAALAFAAITDGNVLHACFGLKASASGRPSDAHVIGQKASSSIFCCFPSPGTMDALQLVLPQTTKNKLRMQSLVEMLREVQDLHHEAVEAEAVGRGKIDRPTVYEKVIGAYTHCFKAIIRHHDARKGIKGEKEKVKGSQTKSADSIVACCSDIFHKLVRPFSKPKVSPELERLQQEALRDIERGFGGLQEEIWEGLEAMAAETAFTGVSVEE